MSSPEAGENPGFPDRIGRCLVTTLLSSDSGSGRCLHDNSSPLICHFTSPSRAGDPQADGWGKSDEGKRDVSCAVSFLEEVRRNWGVAQENVLSIHPNKAGVLEFLAVCDGSGQFDAKRISLSSRPKNRRWDRA